VSTAAGPGFGDAVLSDCLATFPLLRLRVSGDCMAPHLLEGDVVELRPRARRRPRLGDVVLVRLPAGYRLHRVVWRPLLARARGRWRTKADRSRFCDPAVPAHDVMATVVGVERGPRRVRGRSLGAVARSLFRLRHR
jgi:hypothetical protein